MKCFVCGKSEKSGLIERITCEKCHADLEVHQYHLRSATLVCKDPDHELTKGESEPDGPIRVSLGETATRFEKVRLHMAKLGTCHGCLGKSKIEREYLEWTNENRDELSLIGSKLSKKEGDRDVLLKRREELTEQAKKYGRSAAHCVIPNQMLEWYSPMIVVSFFDIHDVAEFEVLWDESANGALEAVEELLMKHYEIGTPSEEARTFDLIMTGLCQALDAFELGGHKRWIPQMLAAMRYAIANRLRVAPSLLLGVTNIKSIALELQYRLEPRVLSLPHRVPKPTTSPLIVCKPPPKFGGGHPLKRRISDVKSLDTNIESMIGSCRASVFEVGKQCHDCEEEQGDDSLITRYLTAQPIGRTLLRAMLELYGGNPWLLTVDFLKAGIDHILNKCNKAHGGSTKQLVPYVEVIGNNRLLFSLYYATCMLEGCYGLSPFRTNDDLLSKIQCTNCCVVAQKI